MFRRRPRETVSRKRERLLQERVAELECDLHAKELVIRIKDAEIESMAAVIARDRERVKAEAAGFARQRAEQEGLKGV